MTGEYGCFDTKGQQMVRVTEWDDDGIPMARISISSDVLGYCTHLNLQISEVWRLVGILDRLGKDAYKKFEKLLEEQKTMNDNPAAIEKFANREPLSEEEIGEVTEQVGLPRLLEMRDAAQDPEYAEHWKQCQREWDEALKGL